MKPNGKNELIKYRYFAWLRNAMGKGEHAIDQVAMALDRFEDYTGRKDFKLFRVEQAAAFKRHLASLNGKRSGTKLSKATTTTILSALREFFRWLSDQKGFRGRLVKTDADYFRPSRQDEAISRALRPRLVPTVEQVRTMIAKMPSDTPVARRNRAIVALIALTGARDDAVASFQLQDLDVEGRQLYHDARHVRSKFRKSFPTWFFPVGDDFVDIVGAWRTELITEHDFGPNDALFPKTDTSFEADGSLPGARLARAGWANADPIRKVFREACAAAGLPDFKPHSVRHMLTQVGMQRDVGPEEMKVWSQNLGHDDVLTTFTSYGTVPEHRQREIMLSLWQT